MNKREHSARIGNFLSLHGCLSSTEQVPMTYHIVNFLYNMVKRHFLQKLHLYLQIEDISKNINQYGSIGSPERNQEIFFLMIFNCSDMSLDDDNKNRYA